MNTHPKSATTYIVSGVVIEQNGKYLLVQERQPKVYGLWNLPAGHVDEGETLEQAAIREAKEECGFDVKLAAHLLVIHADVKRPVLHAYKAEIRSGSLAFPEGELLDAKWFTYEEVLELKEQNKIRNNDYVVGAIETVRMASM